MRSKQDSAGRRWMWRSLSWGLTCLLMGFVATPAILDTFAIHERRHELSALQDSVMQTRNRKQRLEKRCDAVESKLSVLRERGFVDGEQERVRNHWLEIVRKHGGKIRQMDIGEVMRRPWSGLDDSISRDAYLDDSAASFHLHSATFTMSVEGSLDTLRSVLRELVVTPPLSVIESISIAPVLSDSDRRLRLNIELRLYGLTDDDGSLDDEYA
ncbi:MAG: hypothetical protein AAF958_10435 [Planctomycetota bacterium]